MHKDLAMYWSLDSRVVLQKVNNQQLDAITEANVVEYFDASLDFKNLRGEGDMVTPEGDDLNS